MGDVSDFHRKLLQPHSLRVETAMPGLGGLKELHQTLANTSLVFLRSLTVKINRADGDTLSIRGMYWQTCTI